MKKPRLRRQALGGIQDQPVFREVKKLVNKEVVSIVKLAVFKEGVNA